MKILQYILHHIKNSITKIAHYNTFHFLRYARFKYVKCLSTNIYKTIKYVKKYPTLLRKIQTLRENNSRILRIRNAKFSAYHFNINTNTWKDFRICIGVPLRLHSSICLLRCFLILKKC